MSSCLFRLAMLGMPSPAPSHQARTYGLLESKRVSVLARHLHVEPVLPNAFGVDVLVARPYVLARVLEHRHSPPARDVERLLSDITNLVH